jgi:uncharacterized iron-regulated protein
MQREALERIMGAPRSKGAGRLLRRAPGGQSRIAALVAAAGLACASAQLGRFASPLHADHPLVGLVWSHDAGTPVSFHLLERRVDAARFVLLGETHDNADHHRLQARLLARLAGGSRPPAVAFEMLARGLQPGIDAFLAAPGRDPDAFAERVGWETSGWPPFALYRPIFAVALDAGLPILAAGRARDEADDPGAPERDARFGLGLPLPPEEQTARIEEMFESHCGLIPRERLGPMVEIQRARDARMASALLEAAEARGRAVLAAGAGHVERGGVPALLERAGVPRDAIVSVAFLEVSPDAARVEETSAREFDFAVFTPAAEREDPCEALRRRSSG